MLRALQTFRQPARCWSKAQSRSCGGNPASIWANNASVVPLSTLESFTKTYLSFDPICQKSNISRELLFEEEVLNNFDNCDAPKILKSMLLLSSNGILFAMRLRSDVILQLRKSKDPVKLKKLQSLNDIVVNYLECVFSRNILSHQRITFEHSSGIVLAKVAEAEAVHRIRALSELKKRLSSKGRRCFSLFHPCLENEPLTFVHVSLSLKIATSMRDIYKNEETSAPTCAIYYSINSPHPSLGGLNIAESLLKRTTSELTRMYPSIQTHSTLSPIPGFMNWLSTLLYVPKPSTLTSDANATVHLILDEIRVALQFFEDVSSMTEEEVFQLLISTLKMDGWHAHEEFCNAIKHPLLWLCHYYLLEAKQPMREGKTHLTPLDPVSRFHLRNGAILYQINWLANIDAAGLKSSAGMMVNYLYDLSNVEDLKQEFQSSGGVIPQGKSVQKFLSSN